MHCETESILFLLLEICLQSMILFGASTHDSAEAALCLNSLGKLMGLFCISTLQFHMCCSSTGFLLYMFLWVKIFLSNAER